MKEINDGYIKNCQDTCQNEIDCPPSYEDTHIQKIILQYPESQKDGGDTARTPHGVYLKATYCKYVRCNEQCADPHAAQYILYPVFLLIIFSLPHAEKQYGKAVKDSHSGDH